MKKIIIDWKKTGAKLEELRRSNKTLRRNVCRELRRDSGLCEGDGNCESCELDMDRSISRAELAEVFNYSPNIVYNWEAGKTPVSLENIMFYCSLAGVKLEDIIVGDEVG